MRGVLARNFVLVKCYTVICFASDQTVFLNTYCPFQSHNIFSTQILSSNKPWSSNSRTAKRLVQYLQNVIFRNEMNILLLQAKLY